MTNGCTLDRQELFRFYENLRDKKPNEFLYTPKQGEIQKSEMPLVPVFSKGYCPDNFESMKISFVPSIKRAVAAEFDGLVERCVSHILEIKQGPNIKVDNSNLLIAINYSKDSMIKAAAAKHAGNESMWREIGLEGWLDKRIQAISLPNKLMTLKEINEFNIQFWKDCSVEWLKDNKLEKHIPNKQFQERMDEVRKRIGLEYSDCRIFAACYLDMEEQLKKTSRASELVLNQHHLASKPEAGDLIIYLNSNNESLHFGVCKDSKRVISKHYDKCILIHDIEDEGEGTAYVAVRRNR